MIETTASTDPKPIILQLQRGKTVAGRVLDEDRKPVLGAQVYLGNPQGRTPASFGATIPPTVADERGCFLFQGIAEDERLWVQAYARRQGKYLMSQAREAGPGDHVEIVILSQR